MPVRATTMDFHVDVLTKIMTEASAARRLAETGELLCHCSRPAGANLTTGCVTIPRGAMEQAIEALLMDCRSAK